MNVAQIEQERVSVDQIANALPQENVRSLQAARTQAVEPALVDQNLTALSQACDQADADVRKASEAQCKAQQVLLDNKKLCVETQRKAAHVVLLKAREAVALAAAERERMEAEQKALAILQEKKRLEEAARLEAEQRAQADQALAAQASAREQAEREARLATEARCAAEKKCVETAQQLADAERTAAEVAELKAKKTVELVEMEKQRAAVEQQALQSTYEKLRAERQRSDLKTMALKAIQTKLAAETSALADAQAAAQAEMDQADYMVQRAQAEQENRLSRESLCAAEKLLAEKAIEQIHLEQQAAEITAQKIKETIELAQMTSAREKTEQQALKAIQDKIAAEQNALSEATAAMQAEMAQADYMAQCAQAEQENRLSREALCDIEKLLAGKAIEQADLERQAVDAADEKAKRTTELARIAGARAMAEQQALKATQERLAAEQKALADAEISARAESRKADYMTQFAKAQENHRLACEEQCAAEKLAAEKAAEQVELTRQAVVAAEQHIKAEIELARLATERVQAEQQALEAAQEKVHLEEIACIEAKQCAEEKNEAVRLARQRIELEVNARAANEARIVAEQAAIESAQKIVDETARFAAQSEATRQKLESKKGEAEAIAQELMARLESESEKIGGWQMRANAVLADAPELTIVKSVAKKAAPPVMLSAMAGLVIGVCLIAATQSNLVKKRLPLLSGSVAHLFSSTPAQSRNRAIRARDDFLHSESKLRMSYLLTKSDGKQVQQETLKK